VSVFGLGEIARRNIGIDKSVDDKVVRESKKKNIVIEAHLSGFLIPKADLKVYLEADFILRSKRIARRDKSGVLKAFFELRKRDRADIKRWKKRCDFDYTNRKFYDTVIDTSGLKVMDVVGEIMKKIKGGKK
ncbi:MAG: cytidylate kinase family protein, partial [Nanoarchaeota archaeon]|nr:cytidylate kinase family protein [Nanoarchaeota archaeon]